MQRLWWTAFLCLVACLEPSYVTCGDIACPGNVRCVELASGAVCAPPGGCDQLPPDAACDPGDGHDGFCTDGACIPAPRCGDGVLDGDELCDCGLTDEDLRPDCAMLPNSDDNELSPCRADCTPRRCGDGTVDAFEQCEGTNLNGATCGSLGFYRGDLACTQFCSFTGCEGRCGDDVFDADVEFCEPSIAGSLAGYCADFGFAAGSLRCSPLCGPSFEGCRAASAFTDLLPGVVGIREMVRAPDGGAWVLSDDVGLAVYRPGRPIELRAMLGYDLDDFADRVAVGLANGTVEIHDLDGLVATANPPFACRQIVLLDADHYACFGVQSVAWCDLGACDAPFATLPGILDVHEQAGGNLLAASYDAVHRVTPTSSVAMTGETQRVLGFDETPDGIFGGLAYVGSAVGGLTYGLVKLAPATQVWEPVYGSANDSGLAYVGGRDAHRTRGGGTQLEGLRQTMGIDGGFTSCRRFVDSAPGTALCLADVDFAPRFLRFNGASVGAAVPGIEVPSTRTFTLVEDRVYAISNNSTLQIDPPAPAPTAATWQGVDGSRPDAIVLWGVRGLQRIVATWDGTTWLERTTRAVVRAAPHTQHGVAVAEFATTGCDVSAATGTGPLVLLAAAIPCPSSLWIAPNGDVWMGNAMMIKNLTTGLTRLSSRMNETTALGGHGDIVWASDGETLLRWDGTVWSVEVVDIGARFEWLRGDGTRAIATSGGTSRTTWLYDGGSWSKLRLPSDPTAMRQPRLRSDGIVFIGDDARLRFSVWLTGWP